MNCSFGTRSVWELEVGSWELLLGSCDFTILTNSSSASGPTTCDTPRSRSHSALSGA